MTTELDAWIVQSGRTLDNAPDAPRGLYDRLKYVADLLHEAPDLPKAPTLIYRESHSKKIYIVSIHDKIVIGRETPADVHVNNPGMSQTHFQIAKKGDQLLLTDLASRNGTYVNGKKITTLLLCDGDIIETAGQVFVFLGY